jgi:hypothetical protein
VADGGVKIQRAMGLVTVQKHRYRDNRDVGEQHCDRHEGPPGRIELAKEHTISFVRQF